MSRILRKDLVDGDVFRYAEWYGEAAFIVGDETTPLKGVCRASTNESAIFQAPVILLSGPTHDRLTGRNEVALDTPGDDGGEQALADRADVTAQPHYADLKPEPIDVIEGWGLNFRLGNAIKYVARAGRKPLADAQGSLQRGRDTQDGSQDAGAARDLRKAISYLERELAALEGRRAWK